MEEAFGPYRLVRRIGEGAMAEVFLATRSDDPDSRHVVVKRMLPRHREQRALVDMFVFEARLALRLEHPNIVDVHDTGQVGDDYYMAMEHVVGVDLYDLIAARAAAVPPGPAARIVLDVCAGLHYLHETGTVHNDVNPRNVIVADDGTCKLTDFGVALSENSVDARVRGTPAYMAPEQVRNEPLDRRTDVFAVGVLLWELFAAKRLFGGHPPYITIAKIVEDPAPALRDSQLNRIAQRALAKDANARYPDTRSLGVDLEALVRERGWDAGRDGVRKLVEALMAKR